MTIAGLLVAGCKMLSLRARPWRFIPDASEKLEREGVWLSAASDVYCSDRLLEILHGLV